MRCWRELLAKSSLGRFWSSHSEEEHPLLDSTRIHTINDLTRATTTTTGIITATQSASVQTDVRLWDGLSHRPLLLLLVITFLDRLFYFSLTVANMTKFLNKWLNISAADAQLVNSIFFVVVHVGAILTGLLSDSTHLGRFSFVAGGLFLEVVGSIAILLCMSQSPGLNGNAGISLRAVVWGSFALIGIGVLLLRPNLMPFGVDQCRQLGVKAAAAFIQQFVFALFFSELIAFSFVAYLQAHFAEYWGVLVPSVSIILAFSLFLLNWKKFNHHVTVGRPVQMIAWALSCADEKDTLSFVEDANRSSESQGCCNISSLMSRDEVDEAEKFRQLVKIMSIFVVFNAIYYQIFGTLKSMIKLFEVPSWLPSVGSRTGSLSHSLNLMSNLTTVLLLPVFGPVVYPLLRMLRLGTQLMTRMKVGIFFVFLMAILGAVLEHERQAHFKHISPNVTDSPTALPAPKRLSLFWITPLYVLMGLSQVFTITAELEFCNAKAPQKMRAVSMSIYYITLGLGYLLSYVITKDVLEKWAHSDRWFKVDTANGWGLQVFFVSTAALLLVLLVVLKLLSAWFREKPRRAADTPSNHISSHRRMMRHLHF